MTDAMATELRLAHANDEGNVHAFLARLSARTVQSRYLGPLKTLEGSLGNREAQRLLDGNQRRHVVVVTDASARIRGIGEFFVDDSGVSAELALVVEDRFQGRGLGELLYSRLQQLARELGIAQFTGDVSYGNRVVTNMLRRTRRRLRPPVQLLPAAQV